MKYKSNNIGKIINDGLKNPVVKRICMHPEKYSNDEVKKKQLEFSRFIGYCILFKSNEDVEKYMLIDNKKEQIIFLKKKIAKKIGIKEEDINIRNEEIIKFVFENFKKNGYVFHAANSVSIRRKMINGLVDNDVDIEQQRELLDIEAIYRKYNPDSQYSPIGHGAEDIKSDKVGWFFDGLPIHSTGYANSPQWFSYLCGKSYVYFSNITEDNRNGYASRDYKKSLNAISWLIKNGNMNLKDKKILLDFFNKCWNQYKDATPCLMFIPVEEVGVNDEIKIDRYLCKDGINELFEDVIMGRVNPIKNCCCKKKILPEKLSFVDLSSILPRKISKINNIEEKSIIRKQENIDER